ANSVASIPSSAGCSTSNGSPARIASSASSTTSTLYSSPGWCVASDSPSARACASALRAMLVQTRIRVRLSRVPCRPVEPSGIRSAKKDEAHMTPDWQRTERPIAGTEPREVKNIVTGNSVTVELFRKDWELGEEIVHAIFVTLRPGAVSAWHMHKQKT